MRNAVLAMLRRTPGRNYAFEAESLRRAGPPKLSARTADLLEVAEAEARALDDNHVGTEHLVLGLFRIGPTDAQRALESLGITREVVTGQLAWEAGPSPAGPIPLTPRAQVIVGLAGVEARGAPVEPEHLLIAVIRESEKWQASGLPGPHHLLAAASAVGATLADIERRLGK